MLKPADVLASNGRGVVREVRVAVFAVIPRHDDERTTNDSYYAYVAFSFAQRSFFSLFCSFLLCVFLSRVQKTSKVPKMVLKKLIKERSLFVCNFNTPNKRMQIFFFGFFVSPRVRCLQKSAESKSVGARREREKRPEREKGRERERRSARE